MNDSIKSRIQKLAKLKGLSIRKFEETCSLGRGNISNMKEHGTLGSDKLSKIIDKMPDISVKWLITGEGEIYNNNPGETYKVGEFDDNPLPIASDVVVNYKILGSKASNTSSEKDDEPKEIDSTTIETQLIKMYEEGRIYSSKAVEQIIASFQNMNLKLQTEISELKEINKRLQKHIEQMAKK